MFTKLITAVMAFSCLVLTGCSTVSDFQVKSVDGRPYIMHWPVVATGSLEEIRVTEKDGTVHNISKAAGSVAGEYAGSTNLLKGLTGMSSLGAGAAVGGIGAVFDVIATLSSPRIEMMVRRNDEGDLINVPMALDYIKIAERLHCVQLGDEVNVVKKGRAFDLYNANPNLLRLSDFQPSCDELRAQAGLPVAATKN